MLAYIEKWIVLLTCNQSDVSSNPLKAPVVLWSKKLCSHCLLLGGSKNGFERVLHHSAIKLNKITVVLTNLVTLQYSFINVL